MFSLFAMIVASAVSNADIRPLLRAQGFEGPINGSEQISYVGHIPQGADDYRIYIYRGAFRAAAVDHGVNRVIVILNGSIFLGQYNIPMPTDCTVRGQQVICNTESPGVIEFTKRGPPSEVWFDGEVLRFVLSNKPRG